MCNGKIHLPDRRAARRFDRRWLSPFLRLGFTRPLEASDLGALHPSDNAEDLADKLQHLLDEQPAERPMVARLYRALIVHEPIMIIAGIGKLLGDMLGFIGPISLAGIVDFVAIKMRGNGAQDEVWGIVGYQMEKGYWWLLALFWSGILQNLCLHQHHAFAIRAGVHIRSALSVLAYRKAMRMSAQAKSAFGAGFVQNLASTDANTVNMVYWFIHYSWAAPLQLCICMAMLYAQLGPSAFVALGVLIALVPVQGMIASMTSRYMKATMTFSDSRVKLINEIVTGIRIIKFMAWESPFSKRVQDARSGELNQKRKAAVVNAINSTVLDAGPLAVALLSFLSYGYTSTEPLTATRAFTALSLFNILRLPLMVFPSLISTIASADVSVNRLAKFFDSPDMVDYRTFSDDQQAKEASDVGAAPAAAIELKNATLAWDAPVAAVSTKGVKPASESATSPDSIAVTVAEQFLLRNVNLAIPTGKLTTIVGAVGSGKSSILSAVLGEMNLNAGQVVLRRSPGAESANSVPGSASIAYCAQSPWILNASIKDNILFGSQFDEKRFERAIDVCALTADLAILPAGVGTEIGERGVNLSGGQKARVALARAVYSTCPIVLLDDVLSAVDAHVARHIFTHAICGEMKGRTIVLVSHQLQFVPGSDLVVVMDKGSVLQTGSYGELIRAAVPAASAAVSLAAMMQQRGAIDSTLADSASGVVAAAAVSAVVPSPVIATTGRNTPGSADAAAAKASEPGGQSSPVAAAPAAGDKGKLMTDEDRLRGSVPVTIYWSYLRSFGAVILLWLVATLLASNTGRVGTDWWLGVWSTDELNETVGYYVGIHAAITAATSLLVFAHMLCWAFGGVHAALLLHNSMFDRVLRSPTSFFDTTPVGRILNRFSADISTVDKDLPASFNSFVNLFARIGASIVVQAVILPWTLIAVAPVALLYYGAQQFYRHSSRELKRLDAVSKSPVYAHLSESLSGLPVIRAFNGEARFIASMHAKVDANVKVYWRGHLINRWLGLRLDWIGSLLVGSTGLVAVLTAGQINPGLIGLALSYSLALTGNLNWLVRSSTETETYLASVERIEHYAGLPVERPAVIESNRPNAIWPSQGGISVRELTVRYRPDLPPVLSAVTFDVQPGHKVGICGRTGSGKSSLMLSLFRILEAESGSISIDDVDTATIGLDDLRSRLATIPQEPILFSGPLRYNLDPLNAYTDNDIWLALERVQLSSVVRSMGGLDAAVTEGGDNLSVGQRQLLCMARALLKKAKVLVLDEATASVDVQTDSLIQSMIRTVFVDATVLVIAHRIDTILDCDRVLVLDGGRVAEYGHPKDLMAREEGSMFGQLVKQSAANHTNQKQ